MGIVDKSEPLSVEVEGIADTMELLSTDVEATNDKVEPLSSDEVTERILEEIGEPSALSVQVSGGQNP